MSVAALESLGRSLKLASQKEKVIIDKESAHLRFLLEPAVWALALSALWGALVGIHVWQIGLLNLLKVPGIIIFATLGSLPAGIVALKLTGIPMRARDFIRAFHQSVFAGTLVMAVLAPMVALFYRSSATLGPRLAIASAILGFGVAIVILLRRLLFDLNKDKHASALDEETTPMKRDLKPKPAISKPLIVFAVFSFALVFGAVLIQSIAVFSPILPELTLFDGGVDSFFGRR